MSDAGYLGSGDGRELFCEHERAGWSAVRFFVDRDGELDDDWLGPDFCALLEVLKRSSGCDEVALLDRYDEVAHELWSLLGEMRDDQRSGRIRVQVDVAGEPVGEVLFWDDAASAKRIANDVLRKCSRDFASATGWSDEMLDAFNDEAFGEPD